MCSTQNYENLHFTNLGHHIRGKTMKNRGQKRHWWSFFYAIFIEKMYIKEKLKECRLRQNQGVHIRANVFHSKLRKFAFYESWSSYTGENDEKQRPEKIHWWSFFYAIFIKKMYVKEKLKECWLRQNQGVHIRANVFHSKLRKFAFYESWSSYTRENDEKQTRP